MELSKKQAELLKSRRLELDTTKPRAWVVDGGSQTLTETAVKIAVDDGERLIVTVGGETGDRTFTMKPYDAFGFESVDPLNVGLPARLFFDHERALDAVRPVEEKIAELRKSAVDSVNADLEFIDAIELATSLASAGSTPKDVKEMKPMTEAETEAETKTQTALDGATQSVTDAAQSLKGDVTSTLYEVKGATAKFLAGNGGALTVRLELGRPDATDVTRVDLASGKAVELLNLLECDYGAVEDVFIGKLVSLQTDATGTVSVGEPFGVETVSLH